MSVQRANCFSHRYKTIEMCEKTFDTVFQEMCRHEVLGNLQFKKVTEILLINSIPNGRVAVLRGDQQSESCKMADDREVAELNVEIRIRVVFRFLWRS